jgi:phage terminase large subunit-like protein
VSAALELLCSLVLEDGRRWGAAAAPFQRDDARAILEPASGGPLLHFLTRPRGGSKTTDLGAVGLVALVDQLPPSSRVYWIAADRDQGRLGVDAMAGLVARSGLSRLLKVDTWRVAGPNGSCVEVLAADGPSAFGLRPAMVVADELAQWPSSVNARQVWEAVVSAVPKVPGCRLVVITTAGDPVHWSAKVRARALVSGRWRVNEVAGPLPWVDRAGLEEQRALLTDSQFARLHLNVWTASEDRLVSVEALAAAVVLDGPLEPRPGVLYRIGVDVGLRHDRTAVAVVHAESAGHAAVGRTQRRRVVLDRLVVLSGSKAREVQLEAVEELVAGLSASYNRALVRLDPWQAIGLAQRLRPRGVAVEEYSFTAQRYAGMASTLFTLLRDRLLWLPDDEKLLDELATVRLREAGSTGLLRVDHDPGHHDDQVVALGFAATSVLEAGGWAVSGPVAGDGRSRLERPLTSGLLEAGF